MTTFYDDLGVGPDATIEDLRRAYRGLARQLHPDLAPGREERMRRVNQAWKVLADPASRQRYDQSLREAPADAASPPQGPWGPPEPPPPMRWLRPSVVAIAILTIIFIATAYVGPHPGSRPAVPAPGAGPSTTAAAAAAAGGNPSGLVNSAMVGQCLRALAGYDALVPCTQRNDGLVVGQTSHSADCPAGTAVHQLAGRPLFVCLAGMAP